MACLDTDFLVALLRGSAAALQRLDTLEAQGLPLATTALNAMELYKGAALSAHPTHNEREVEILLARLELLTFDAVDARNAGKIMARLKRQGKPSGTINTLIAGIVLHHDEALVTRNQRHFMEIEGLKLESW